MTPYLVAVMGPTASGKTDFAEGIADHLGGLLVNADAFQVYRGLDIGTAKPVHKNRYRLMDLKDPDEEFGLGEWLRLAHVELSRAWERRQSVVVVGGTGLYVRALFEGYDDLAEAPSSELRRHWMERLQESGLESLAQVLRARAPEVAAITDLANPVRVTRALERLDSPRIPVFPLPGFRRAKYGLSMELPKLQARLEQRLGLMVANGWLAEVQTLIASKVNNDAPGMRAIGYRTWYDHLSGQLNYSEAFEIVRIQTLQYAKRQRTWLRREPGLISVDASAAPNPESLFRSLEG